MRMQFVRMLHWPSGESTMAPENEKLQNTSTTHSHEPTRLPNHTPTEPPTHTHQATHPRRATAIQQYTYSRTCVGILMPSLSLCSAGIPIFTILRHPGKRATRPREGAFPRHPLAEPGIGARSFALGLGEQLCGAGVARSWCRGDRVAMGSRSCF